MRRWLAATMFLALAGMANAQDPVADFYRGKQIFLRIGSSAGSGYDLAGRVVAPYLTKYMPGSPSVVVQNAPGAGGLALANQIYNSVARDGTIIGPVSNGMPTAPLLTPEQARFDVTKFSWIGSNAPEQQIILMWHSAPAQTIDDFFKVETLAGSTTTGVAIYDMPLLLNALMGTKFKVVLGYEGSVQIDLAMERGEVHGQIATGWISVKARASHYLRDGRMRILAQFGGKPHPDLVNVPMFPMPQDDIARQVLKLMYARQDYGRPLVAPPGVQTDRIAALRKAYLDAMRDPDLRADAVKAGLEINPVGGEDLDELTRSVVATSPAAVDRLKAILAQ